MNVIIYRGLLVFWILSIPELIFTQTITDFTSQNEEDFFHMVPALKGNVRGSNYLRRFEIQPYVMTENDPFSIICEVSVPGIKRIVLDFLGQWYHNNSLCRYLILYDDGQNGDDKEGDNIFSINNLKHYTLSNLPITYGFYQAYCEVTYNFNNGDVQKEILDPGISYGYFNSTRVEIPIVKRINDSIQYSSHVLNIVLKPDTNLSYDFWSITGYFERAARTYYKFFPDDIDFLDICTTYPTPSLPYNAAYFRLRNSVLGISGCNSVSCLFNNSIYYGSNNLQGIILDLHQMGGVCSMLNHEILHQWAAFLPYNLNLSSSGGHWKVVELHSTGFGHSNVCSRIYHYRDSIYRSYCDETWSIKYNSLELYLMGLLPFASVSFPIKILINSKILGFADSTILPNKVISVAEYTADSIHLLSKEEYLSFMPLRTPDFSSSQKDFKLAQIVISSRLLTPKEMAFYNYRMKENESRSPYYGSMSGFNFFTATGGRGTLKTVLSDPVDKDQDGYLAFYDCNDDNALINPGAEEIPGNNIDENCDGIITDIEIPAFGEIKIYPNPVKSIINIDYESNTCYSVKIRELGGRVLRHEEIQGNHNVIMVDKIPAGLYILEISDINAEKSVFYKIIKVD